jgi:hypothetical protein
LKAYYTNYTDIIGLTEDKIDQLMFEMKEQELKRATGYE